MKILVHSNAPHTSTGYGVQCAQLVERLHDAGHDVAVSATYGQQGEAGGWRPKNPRNPDGWDKPVRVYPSGWALNGLDIVHNHALHWFGGDPLGGWIILLGDVWSLAANTLLSEFNVLAWTPVDHYPVPPGVLRFFQNTGAVPVAMSQFGQNALSAAGLDTEYVPLAVDRAIYKPTPTLAHPVHGEIPGRQLLGIPDEAFLVGMVAMNKDPNDRKGFNEAFSAFAAFHKNHPDAILYVHTDPHGMGTSFDLNELARACQIPDHAIRFPDVYGYQTGWSGEMMAAAYTAFDVLLAPSHGEGFCVPLIEAQACGTPVIVTDFSAQPELVGAGWKVLGQPSWDAAQSAFYIVPYINELVNALEQAYQADLDLLAVAADMKATEYDADRVFDNGWEPILELCAAPIEPLPGVDRTAPFDVRVIVPFMRPDNLERLLGSFYATTDGTVPITLVVDNPLDLDGVDASILPTGKDRTGYAEKVNLAYRETDEPWLLVVGDDVEFHPGWLEEAIPFSFDWDVIGTNDSLPGRTRNPAVASGEHADHFFIRRAYIEKYGANLDGPGEFIPTCYGHWFVDREIIDLAKMRGTFIPCLRSVVEHHHPGYDRAERDDVYLSAIDTSDTDLRTYTERSLLLGFHRRYLGRRP